LPNLRQMIEIRKECRTREEGKEAGVEFDS